MRLACLTAIVLALLAHQACAEEKSPRQVFEQRILPIFRSPNPSSCTQCHLAAVDLKHYILPSSEKTFLSLRDQGMIDLKTPAQSKILRMIKMGEEDKGAALIHDKVRKAEYEAFAEWIKMCCNDPNLRDAPKLTDTEKAQPPRPNEVIRHARKDRLLESFEQNVWSMRFRCMSCHIEGTPQNDKLKKEHGERVAWFKAAGAEATMNYLLQSDLIDRKDPAKSLLLLKPLNEVKHGGGKKLLFGDQGYKGFRAWLDDYAAIVNDKYARAADLPKKTERLQQVGTDIWLKLADTPPAWKGKLLQVTLYAWDEKAKGWEADPIATSDRELGGQGIIWQHNLTLMAAPGSKRAEEWKRKPALPPGRFLIKVHVDFKDRLAGDWRAVLGNEEYAGQVEVTSRWQAGYGQMTVVKAEQVRR